MFKNPKYNFLYFAIILLLIQSIFFTIGNKSINDTYNQKQIELGKVESILNATNLQARAVSVYDMSLMQELYGKNENESYPIASIAKIMTAVIAMNEKAVNEVKISYKALMQESDYGLFVNEKFDKEELVKFTLVGSSNDGAYALSEMSEGFIDRMNDKARRIGMENTVFLNATGLDVDEAESGAYASAEDVNIMAMYALRAYPEIFIASSLPEYETISQNGFYHKVENTNTLINEIPELLLSKTGLTSLAGGNLVIIYKNEYGHNIAITVLGSTIDGRFSDVEKIIKALYTVKYGGN